MKTKLFTLLLAVAASVGTMFASTKIGNLYYNLDATNQTAEVAENRSASGEIIIPASVTYNSVTYSVTSIGEMAFYYCTELTSVTIGNSVTSIGSWAFDECTGLTSVTIGNSVTSIGSWAFRFCSGLTSVHISDIAAWCAISFGNHSANPLYYAHNLYLNGELVTDLVIPNSVTSIGNYAFRNCTGLTSVTIPNSVTSIGSGAFYGCSGLTSIEIPNSVTSIGIGAFYGCTGLTSVTCFATRPPQLDSYVFEGVDKSIPLYVPAGSVSAYKSADQWKDFTNILPISQQGVEEVLSNQVPSTKILRNGQIFILRGDKTYTLQGQEVR